MASRAQNPLPESEESEEEGLSLQDMKEIAGFVLRAPKRRPKLAIAGFVVTCALGITAAITMPNTYNSQVKLLAQQNLVVPALTNPGRQVPRDADNPTKNVGDQIMRRDNLVALAKETDLVKRYYAQRSAPLKLKDKILAGAMTDEDRMKIVVATLETKVTVKTEDNNVTISVDWYQPDTSFDLVSKLQENFQAARYDDDVAMIKDAITVLQQHAKDEADAVDAALEEYRKLVAEESEPVDAGVPAAPATTTVVVRRRPARSGGAAAAYPVPASLDPEIADELETKRAQIRAIEEGRAKQLEQLREQLGQAQLELTPQHPTIIALQQKIDAMNEPDPQLAQLKAEEKSLLASIAPPPAIMPTSPRTTTSTYTTQVVPVIPTAPKQPESTLGTPREDPKVALMRAKLEGSIRRYQDAVSRLESANVELEVARTAFKYRYTVVTPPEVPNKPKKPVKTMVGVGSVIGAILLAFLLAAGADMASGRVLEEWQVRRRLKLDVLGDFDPSRAQLPPRTS